MDNENKLPIQPFLKWAGGKRWLVKNYSNLIPRHFNRYIEPFLGSGAVFFYLQPNDALIGDTNKDLVETYQALKQDWKLLYVYLERHHARHNREYYYHVRSQIPSSNIEKAARFIYLNRTCWNGLYRVNLNGTFNVPIGTKTKVIYDDDQFGKISDLLQKAQIVGCDFEVLIDQASAGDFLFVDPPYTVRHNNNSFIKYNEILFSWADQERLFLSLVKAKERGAFVFATNAFHRSLIELYYGNFKTFPVSRMSAISSNVKTRRKFQELIILST